jgi:UDP-glucose 4-epimerase
METVLITGGRGYVGGRVVQHLQQNPAYIIRVGGRAGSDNFADSTKQGNWVDTDWRSNESLQAACKDVDTIIHLAAMNEIDCAKDPVAALEANGVATARLLEAAMASGVKRFIYLSTAHVYAAPLAGYIDEKTLPMPQHPYATSHRAAEDVVLAAHLNKKIEALIIRMSNSFGAPVDLNVNRWSLLVNDLCVQAVQSKKLTLKSSGLQRRDFITLEDVSRAMAHFLALPNWREFDNCIFNLGGDWSPTIYEMTCLVADRCLAVLGYNPPIERITPNNQDANQTLDFSIKKLKSTGFGLNGQAFAEIDNTLELILKTK